MAYIKPSLKFEGAETGQAVNTAPYIRENVRRMIFNKNTNQQGVYVYFLSGYKADSFGNGVWYKSIDIRDNFGDKFKEKYYVPNRYEDPAEYFANNYKGLGYADNDEANATVNVNGKQFKKYPNFGRITKRLIFNVVYANNISAGAHVLDLPSYNGASQILEWMGKLDVSGNPRPMINDPERALPVFIQLKENSSNPWCINIETSQPAVLPPELTESENLYNLDDVLIVKSKEEIIAKLRDMYPAQIFEHCMDGFPGLTRSARVPGIERTSGGINPPVAAPVVAPAAPVQAPARIQPVFSGPIQKAQIGAPINTEIPSAQSNQQDQVFADPGEIDLSKLPPNPMARLNSKEAAVNFLSSK